MSTAELLYTFRTPYPDVFQRGRAALASMPVYRDGAVVAVTASGSTFSFLAPDGTAIVDAAAVTVTAGGLATYPLTLAHLADTRALGEGYQELWKLVLPDGTTRTTDREAALALRPLNPVITDEDLKGDYPLMTRDLPAELPSWQKFIDEGWKEIVGRIISEGHLTYSVKSSWSFRTPHKELVHGKRFRALAGGRSTQANYLELSKDHLAAYEAAWKGMNWTTDDNHDGRVDDPSKRRAGGSAIVHVNASSTTRYPSRVRDPRW